MSNHGKVGEALYLKFTKEKFDKLNNTQTNTKHGDIITVEELENTYHAMTIVPVHIDDTTQGNYECVCEHGIEIH